MDDRIVILDESVPLRTGWENKDLAKMFMQFCHICNLNRFATNSLGNERQKFSYSVLTEVEISEGDHPHKGDIKL